MKKILAILLLIAIALPMLSCELPLPKKEDLENQEGGIPDTDSEDIPSDAFTEPVLLWFGREEDKGFAFLKDLQDAAEEGDDAVQALTAASLGNDLKTHVKTSADVEVLFQEIGNVKIPLIELEGTAMSPLSYQIASDCEVPEMPPTYYLNYYYKPVPIESISSVGVTIYYREDRPTNPLEALFTEQYQVLLYTEELEEGTLWVYRQEVPQYDDDGNYIETLYNNPDGILITDNSTVEFTLFTPYEQSADKFISVEEVHQVLDTMRISTLLQEIGG